MPFPTKNTSTAQPAQPTLSKASQPRLSKDQISRPSQQVPFGFGHDLSFRLISLEEAAKRKKEQSQHTSRSLVKGGRGDRREPFLGSCWSDSEEDVQRKRLIRRTHRRNNTDPVVPATSSCLAPSRRSTNTQNLRLMKREYLLSCGHYYVFVNQLPALPVLPEPLPIKQSTVGATRNGSPSCSPTFVSLDDIFSTSTAGQEYLDGLGLRYHGSHDNLSLLTMEAARDDCSMIDQPSLGRLLGSRQRTPGTGKLPFATCASPVNEAEDIALEVRTIVDSELDASDRSSSVHTETVRRGETPCESSSLHRGDVWRVLAELRRSRDVVSVDWRSIDEGQGDEDEDDLFERVLRESLVVRRQSHNRTNEEEERIEARRRAVLLNPIDMSRLDSMLDMEVTLITDEPEAI
ncbi:hypothetical protein FRC19_002380 [Serendipita sp. 401]|nr:hypothetical protein FRC19_002380 [Serendipita sp. 401]